VLAIIDDGTQVLHVPLTADHLAAMERLWSGSNQQFTLTVAEDGTITIQPEQPQPKEVA
jgi:hypothetical protein